MAVAIKVTVKGHDKVLRQIDKMGKLPKELKPLFETYDKILRADWGANFNKQGTEEGGKWGALKYTRPKKYQGKPIGINTGDMARSVLGRGNDTFREISDRRAELGVEGIKAVVFDNGSVKQVARPIITVSNNAKVKLQRALRLFVHKAQVRV